MNEKISSSSTYILLFCFVYSGLCVSVHRIEEENQITTTDHVVYQEDFQIPDESSSDDLFLINKRAHMLEHLYEGDIKLNPFRNAHGNKWPKSSDGLVRIPVEINPFYSDEDKLAIRSALKDYHKHTCIRFPNRKSQKNFIGVNNGFGCSSLVGRSTDGEQRLTLGKIFGNCVTRGTILHEFMHAIGFLHEQSRSDRDKYIRVVEENTYAANGINLRREDNTTNLVVYDYHSVMHYGKYGLGKEIYLPPLRVYPRRNRSNKINYGNQGKFSAYDIEEIKYYYECEPGTYQRCGRDFVNQRTGSFRSPSYPNNYPADVHCTWNITVRSGRYIELSIRDTQIESRGSDCESDAFIVHDGHNAGAPVMRKICGSPTDAKVTSTGNHLFIIFTSNSAGQLKGFRATFMEVTKKGSPPPALPTEPPVPAITTFANEFRCNFNTNLCGMTQDTVDETDFGHTGEHIITSLTSTGNDAIIRSPWFESGRQLCVKFKFHMHGRSMGALRVYAHQKIRSKRNGNDTLLWEKLGSQENRWLTAQITYTPTADVEYLQFYWQAFYNAGNNRQGIDDIEITQRACSPVESLSCDFETGLCGFIQVKRDQFDWIRRRGATPSTETGPSEDHSSGNGHYMYSEASSPRKSGQIARLASPSLSFSRHCFNMWYHMNGTDIGKITIYKSINRDSYVIKEITGSQGNSWKHLEINVDTKIPTTMENPGLQNNTRISQVAGNANTNDIRVIVEATMGNGSKGDIAIDDIEISDRHCIPPPASNFSCDFETDQYLCDLEQAKDDQFDWTRIKGPTPSKHTGPTVDNTKKHADGYYIYIESSKPQKFDDVAKLVTPKLNPGTYCLRFAYHMHGSNVGRLTVLTREKDEEPRIRWLNQRNQGNQWQQAEIEYTSLYKNETVQFLFYGAVGRNSSGDIALDDINIARGTCASTIFTTTSYSPPSTTYATTTTPSTVRPPPSGPELWSGMPLALMKAAGFSLLKSWQAKLASPVCTFENERSRENQLRVSTATIPSSGRDLGPYIYPATTRNGVMCGWYNFAQYDSFDWIRRRGSTPSSRTGPSGDKSSGRGFYMYVESSSPRRPQERAFFQTYAMPASDYCIDMNYHMYGVNMGKLSIRTVQVLRSGRRTRPTLHEIRGNKGNQWKHININFTAATNLESVAFRLEGVVGSGSKSDIAVDDIAILPGRCDACNNPTHNFISSSTDQVFAVGCVHAQLFYIRCCNSSKPKAVYRRVGNCNKNMFSSTQLRNFCRN